MAYLINGIVICNSDISPSVQEMIIKQLFIDYVLTGDEFDAKVTADPDYVNKVKAFHLRIMVLRSFAQNNIVNNIPNRDLADLILFVSHGLADGLTKSGHNPSVPLSTMHWGSFGLY